MFCGTALFQFAIKLILMEKTISFTPTPGGLPLQRCASIQFPNSPWAQTAVRFYCEWNEQQLAKPRPGRVAHCSLSAGSQSVLDVRCKKQFFPSVRIVMIANWNNRRSPVARSCEKIGMAPFSVNPAEAGRAKRAFTRVSGHPEVSRGYKDTGPRFSLQDASLSPG